MAQHRVSQMLIIDLFLHQEHRCPTAACVHQWLSPASSRAQRLRPVRTGRITAFKAIECEQIEKMVFVQSMRGSTGSVLFELLPKVLYPAVRRTEVVDDGAHLCNMVRFADMQIRT